MLGQKCLYLVVAFGRVIFDKCRIPDSLKPSRVCPLSNMVMFIGQETGDPGGRIVSGVSLRSLTCGGYGWNSAGGLNACLVCCVFRPLRVVVRHECI